MGIIDETWADGDFASVFASVAQERRLMEEKRQTELLLRVLDELEERKGAEKPGKVEYLRIGPTGDVIRDKEDEERALRRGKIMTVDQLPKESEYEMLFGKPEPVEPQVKLETGRRLSDGKEHQNLAFPLFDNLRLDLGNMRFETLVVILAAAFLMFTILWRMFKTSVRKRIQTRHEEYMFEKQLQAHTRANLLSDRHIEQEVERRVNERLADIVKKQIDPLKSFRLLRQQGCK